VLAGGQADRYPPSNQFPDSDDLLLQFRDPSADDYRLKAESPLRHAAADGGAAGADVDRLMKCLSSGGAEGVTTPRATIAAHRRPLDDTPRGEREQPLSGCPQPTAMSK
jgi:hypothetical protein